MEQIQPYLEYFSDHPGWALTIVFLIAFGEALLIIGLFVPSTVALVGAGTLVGMGHLAFWPVFLATAVGAILGDQVSYWAGRFWGQQLKEMWPLNRYPQLLLKGEDYVRQHGGKSIAIGRFVPGVKAVVPGIVGMLGMSQVYFVFVNVTSGTVWALAHVVPGILIGQGLAIAGEFSERLVIVLLVLLVLLAVAGWLIRLGVASVSPYIDGVMLRISHAARASKYKILQRLGRALSPVRASSRLILLFSLITIGGLITFVDMLTGLALQGAISNLDLSVNNILRSLRSAPADQLMVIVTMLGDRWVALAIAMVTFAWLVWRRAWRPAIATAATVAIASLALWISQSVIGRVRTPQDVTILVEGAFTFPSPHVVLAGTAFGVIALLVSQGAGRWTRALLISMFATLVIAVAFSRVYLGVHWLSDVIGGLLLAAILVSAFGIVIEAIPTRKIRPVGLSAAVVVALLSLSVAYVTPNLPAQAALYAKQVQPVTISLDQFRTENISEIPLRRIALAGRGSDPFDAIWLGDIDSLQQVVLADKWQVNQPWTWSDSLDYLNTNASLDKLAPQPLLHEGTSSKLTATKPGSDPSARYVLRVYQAEATVDVGDGKPLGVFHIHLSRENLQPSLYLFNVPRIIAAEQNIAKSFNDALVSAGRAEVLFEKTADGRTISVLRPAK